MTNITGLKDPASLEQLLVILGEELEKLGEPPECIRYVSWALSGAYRRNRMADVIVIQESEIGLSTPLKRKVGGLWGELILAYVDLWHCGGGSLDYGDPGPGQEDPPLEANRSVKVAQVIPFYKRGEEADNGR